MANVNTSIAPVGSVAVLRVVDFMLNLKSVFAELYDAHQTRRALSVLTDAQLDDIGLSRADVAKF